MLGWSTRASGQREKQLQSWTFLLTPARRLHSLLHPRGEREDALHTHRLCPCPSHLLRCCRRYRSVAMFS